MNERENELADMPEHFPYMLYEYLQQEDDFEIFVALCYGGIGFAWKQWKISRDKVNAETETS